METILEDGLAFKREEGGSRSGKWGVQVFNGGNDEEKIDDWRLIS